MAYTVLLPVLLVINLIGQSFQLCKIFLCLIRVVTQVIFQGYLYDAVRKFIDDPLTVSVQGIIAVLIM